MTDLYRLDLSQTPVRDLGPISALPRLSSLSLKGVQNADIGALENRDGLRIKQ